MTAQRASLLCVVGMLLALARAAEAEPRGIDRCLAATEQGQLARQQGKYRAARAQFRTCGAASCPDAVNRDCARWLDELDAMQPTVLLQARDARERDLEGVTVRIDDEPTAIPVDGRAVEVDPGVHRFVFVSRDRKRVEHRVVIRESEKNRVVVVEFPVPQTPPAERPQEEVTIPVSSWVLGAIGVAGIGVGAYFLIAGKVEEEHLASTCIDRCPHDDVDAVRRSYWGGGIALGAGLAFLGVAVIIAAVSQPEPHSSSFAPPLGFAF